MPDFILGPFLGYPIWNNDAPRIIYTFLESENLSGKTIFPSAPPAAAGSTTAVSNIQGLASGAAWTASVSAARPPAVL